MTPEVFPQTITNAVFQLAWGVGLLDQFYDMIEFPDGMGVNSYIAYLAMGAEVEGITFPGESLTRNQLPVTSIMRAPHKFVFGLTQDTLGYLVPTDEWDDTGYEESISANRDFGDIVRDKLIALVRNGQQEVDSVLKEVAAAEPKKRAFSASKTKGEKKTAVKTQMWEHLASKVDVSDPAKLKQLVQLVHELKRGGAEMAVERGF